MLASVFFYLGNSPKNFSFRDMIQVAGWMFFVLFFEVLVLLPSVIFLKHVKHSRLKVFFVGVTVWFVLSFLWFLLIFNVPSSVALLPAIKSFPAGIITCGLFLRYWFRQGRR
jgi:hypothetical protein